MRSMSTERNRIITAICHADAYNITFGVLDLRTTASAVEKR